MRYALEGGLGNQIFQYAYFLKVCDENTVKTSELDASWYDVDIGTPRQFTLPQILPINADIYRSHSRASFSRIRYFLYRVARRIDLKLDVDLFQTILRYYNHEKWTDFVAMSDYLSLLHATFMETHCNYLVDDTAVHLRFGDYINNSRYAVVDYNKMLELALANSQSGKIKVFSDDPELAFQYVSKQLQSTRFNIMPKRDEISTFIDLAHHTTIYCSNSTYSYAAALLGPATTIIIPQFWTRDNEFPIPHLQNKSIHTF